MSLPVPLTVRLVTVRADRHVEADVNNLVLRSAMDAGYASAQLSLNRPLRLDVDEIAYYADVIVDDATSGQNVWYGRLEDIGRGAGGSGEIRDLAATGGRAHAQDRNLPHIFTDTATLDWEVATDSAKYGQVNEINSNDVPAVQMIYPQGTTMTQTEYVEVWYRRLIDTGQRIARLQYAWDSASSTPNNEINMVVSVGLGAGTNDELDAAALDTAGGTLTGIITTDFSSATQNDVPRCWFLRNGATLAAGNNATVWFIPCVRTVLYDVDGNERTAAANYTTNYVRAHEVINDLLGRVLTQFDGPNADVATNTYDIDQLAYQEPVTAADILTDLRGFHRDHSWFVWGRRADSGLFDFEWRQLPSTVRFEADVFDGFDSPGSAAQLFNAVSVRWVGAQGRVRHWEDSSTVALLDNAGLTRQQYIDLKLDAGSSNNAIQAGEQFLEDHAVVVNAGTLDISRPIYDRDSGMMRQPWELLRHGPGELIRVRGVQPTLDALNTTTRNAVTVFRITAVEFDANSATARLELDSEPIEMAHALSRAQPRPTVAKKAR